uniref:Uncharacterized protein n=1 Tax=Tanacetum cinerariifolium TaxID=118510 RepID=A0A699SVB9_TANCI|nr:hypothetical protein [Tanacetum cinerariifolium]
MARLWDFKTFIKADFSSSLNALAIMTGNLLAFQKCVFKMERKSLSPNGVSVGEVVETIGSSEGVGLPLAVTLEKPRTSCEYSSQASSVMSILFAVI